VIQQGRAKEVILLSEGYHDLQIVKLAQQIASRKDKLRIVLISGPSSSGKTTFASKLCVQLRLQGLRPVSIEVDMYYKDNDDPSHPRDENGDLNFEVIEAMRVDQLNSDLNKLLNGESIRVPLFSFKEGHILGYGEEIRIPPDGILVMEGIFCLNPKLTEKIKSENKFKIFMCPVSFLNLDNQSFFVRTDNTFVTSYISRSSSPQ